MSESYLVGVILAVVGGYMDAYTYISRGHVFANAQTGNLVLLGINIASGDIMKALVYIPPVFAFILGIFLAEKIRRHSSGLHLHWRQYVLIIELAAIIAVGFIPAGITEPVSFDMIANVTISFVCSLQVQSFRKIRGIICATTMCTGNLRSAAQELTVYLSDRSREHLHTAGKYCGIVIFFISGAALSTLLTGIFYERSVLFCAAGLAAVIILMFPRQP